MLKLLEKIEFKSKENKMRYIADTKIALDQYLSKKSKNLDFLLKKRFNWMNEFIKKSISIFNFVILIMIKMKLLYLLENMCSE